MFGQRAGIARFGQRGLGLGQLGARLADFHAIGDAPGKTPLGHVVGAAIGRHGRGEQLDLAILPAQHDIALGQFGLQLQARVGQIVGSGLGIGAPGRDIGPHPAPDVGLVTAARADRMRAIVIGLKASV
jgi:hypothetical protein